MKKVIYIMVAFISLALCSCGSNDCVKQIATIIENGAEKEQAFEAAVANGEKTDADLQEEDLFMRPAGNVFANPEVKAIIDKNSNYKLSDADKEMLTNAIDKLCPRVPVRYQPTVGGRMLDDLNRKEREYNLANIKAAKTLGDLL